MIPTKTAGVMMTLFGREVTAVDLQLSGSLSYPVRWENYLTFEMPATSLADAPTKQVGSIIPVSSEAITVRYQEIGSGGVERVVGIRVRCLLLDGPETDSIIASFLSGVDNVHG